MMKRIFIGPNWIEYLCLWMCVDVFVYVLTILNLTNHEAPSLLRLSLTESIPPVNNKICCLSRLPQFSFELLVISCTEALQKFLDPKAKR